MMSGPGRQLWEINHTWSGELPKMPASTQTAEALAASGLTGFEITIIKDLGLEDALRGAHEEARNSGLPGLERGPANAYQHLLISGELWRRRGPIAAAAHELGNDARGDQTFLDSQMDGHNNRIVASERPEFNTWEDVVRWARAKILESAPRNGDGEAGRAPVARQAAGRLAAGLGERADHAD